MVVGSGDEEPAPDVIRGEGEAEMVVAADLRLSEAGCGLGPDEQRLGRFSEPLARGVTLVSGLPTLDGGAAPGGICTTWRTTFHVGASITTSAVS